MQQADFDVRNFWQRGHNLAGDQMKTAGLGFEFLRHIQRTRVLIHMLDGLAEDPLGDFYQINSELALFDEHLATKPQIVAVNKLDQAEAQAKFARLKADLTRRGFEVFGISALARTGVREVLYRAAQLLAEAVPLPVLEEVPVYRAPVDEKAFTISREPDGGYRVIGVQICLLYTSDAADE